MGLIDRVEPGGGSFGIWPRTHRRFFHLFKWQYSCRDDSGANSFTPECKTVTTFSILSRVPVDLTGIAIPDEQELERVRGDTVPVDCYGEAGDVVFWQ